MRSFRDNSDGRILFLSGKLEGLQPSTWSYTQRPLKTPIITLPDNSRKRIIWNLNDIRAHTWNEIDNFVTKQSRLRRVGRLREVYAIEIQQKMLTHLGRIGQPANLPATFPVSISLYRVAPDGTAASVDVSALTEAACFCYVGRGHDPTRVDHIVLSETACDALQDVIRKLSPNDVHTRARHSLAVMKSDLEFFERFESGLIQIPTVDNRMQPERGRGNHVYMYFIRNRWDAQNHTIPSSHNRAPLIMKVRDIHSNLGI